MPVARVDAEGRVLGGGHEQQERLARAREAPEIALGDRREAYLEQHVAPHARRVGAVGHAQVRPVVALARDVHHDLAVRLARRERRQEQHDDTQPGESDERGRRREHAARATDARRRRRARVLRSPARRRARPDRARRAATRSAPGAAALGRTPAPPPAPAARPGPRRGRGGPTTSQPGSGRRAARARDRAAAGSSRSCPRDRLRGTSTSSGQSDRKRATRLVCGSGARSRRASAIGRKPDHGSPSAR